MLNTVNISVIFGHKSKEHNKLLRFKALLSKLILLFQIFSLCNMKLKLDSSMTLILVDLNNFIKNRVTAKSSDLTSCLVLSSLFTVYYMLIYFYCNYVIGDSYFILVLVLVYVIFVFFFDYIFILWLNSLRNWKALSIAMCWWVTDVSRTITFPDRRFPDKTFPGQSLSRTITFPERRFPDNCVP